jgi:hypothetical protein
MLFVKVLLLCLLVISCSAASLRARSNLTIVDWVCVCPVKNGRDWWVMNGWTQQTCNQTAGMGCVWKNS